MSYKHWSSQAYRISGILSLIVIGLSILAWSSLFRREKTPCIIVATINDVEILQSEVNFMQAQLILQGGPEDQYSAMLEVLWQEDERQRRGLMPIITRTDARQAVVRQLRYDRLSNHVGPQLKFQNIPQNTQFTDCGLSIISKD